MLITEDVLASVMLIRCLFYGNIFKPHLNENKSFTLLMRRQTPVLMIIDESQ